MPQTMFWMAMASAKTSGDQPRPSLMGAAKSPKLVLRPYVIRAIKHPHKTTKAGARHHPKLAVTKTPNPVSTPANTARIHKLERLVKYDGRGERGLRFG